MTRRKKECKQTGCSYWLNCPFQHDLALCLAFGDVGVDEIIEEID